MKNIFDIYTECFFPLHHCKFHVEGFECVEDDDGESARDAVVQMLHHLRHISSTWADVLPIKVYCKAMGMSIVLSYFVLLCPVRVLHLLQLLLVF